MHMYAHVHTCILNTRANTNIALVQGSSRYMYKYVNIQALCMFTHVDAHVHLTVLTTKSAKATETGV